MEKMELQGALSALYVDIHKYYSLFDEYRRYLIGHDFTYPGQEASNDPKKAEEALKELNDCLPLIANDTKTIKQILSLDEKYPMEQINEANTTLVDIAGDIACVTTRIRLLKESDKLLLDIHNNFMVNKTELNSSLIEYNSRNQTDTFFPLQKAHEIFMSAVAD